MQIYGAIEEHFPLLATACNTYSAINVGFLHGFHPFDYTHSL